ncbi:HD domain-containing protein [Nocardia iowensis]|uniref:HD domain-containing protein n=1 Tax=Nocardia iowensis TaxID=204891 RepID=A0ABX8RLU3_NOCIO|nr:HD domain-containing protein [Nocardia iowensis]QXN89255.1 HD domain-containing protein [Nocardia iowensis]
MEFSLDLPCSSLADAVMAVVWSSLPEPIANHSVRSFLFAELLAEHQGLINDPEYDRELVFAAAVMHDLGTGNRAPGKARFEVEGADIAADVLTRHGASAAAVDRVWEAIAFHTSEGIAERRGLLPYLTAEGSKMDIGYNADLTDKYQEAIHAAYPRLNMVKVLTDAIVDHASRSDDSAPIFSLGNLLTKERQATGVTELELLTAGVSPWGD